MPELELSLTDLLNSMAVGVFVADARGHYVAINRAGLRMLGAQTLDEVQHAAHSRFHYEDGTPIPPNCTPIDRALAGEDYVDAIEIRNEDLGGRLALRCQASPLRSATGDIIGAVKVAIDVTKEFELARVKDEFIRTAAHELKTPLAVIIANAESVIEEAVSSSRSLEGLRRGIERADRLIHSLLDLVDVQGGLFSLARVPVRLDELVALVVSRLPQSSAVRVQLSELEPVTILGDEQRLRRVVQSVVDNAIKYSSKPTPIEIALVAEGGSATLTIRDSGVGIPRELQPRIFEKYFRAHAGTPRDPGGMGISLFVAREVIAQHGGRIWFESVENEGTVFYIELPLATLPRQ